MGLVESGVMKTLASLGVKQPGTALEQLAVKLAQKIDECHDEKALSALSRELRLTLDQVKDQPIPADDPVEKLASKWN